eukprot:TRINITY_DN15073_c0_g1_i1.p1 TRINITY_DN15073_c0_g1~~TRINITY_DN15073_c0_g1_i1.p1  ORF type:complete len:1225 (-),score=224.48 TRINITY_DN15073_c0_g1_i1:118-3792(-)
MSSKPLVRNPSISSSSSSDSDSRGRASSNATGVVLVTAPLDAGKSVHYFYLDGGTISVFYGPDIVAYLEAKELQSAEKISKFLGDSGQLEIVEFPLFFPDGRTSTAEKHIFVTVDGFIRLVCMFGHVDKQRRILWTMRTFIEESFASFGTSGLSSSESSPNSPLWVDSSGDEELIAAFRKGVEVKDRKYHLKTYPQCFIGTEAVDWLVNHHWANTREEAEAVGNRILQKGVFQHVAKEHDFRDKFYFYRFLEPQTRIEINERFKVVLLGPSYSGKTCLFSLLPQKSLKRDQRSKRTVLAQGEVIQRAGWQSTMQRLVPGSNGESSDSVDENIQITLWDFCDHPEADADRQSYEPMHRGMHRLFMTNNRTLYLITTDLSKFNATEMDYWVQNVYEYAPGAPVIIVGTHQDQVTSQRVSEIQMFVKDRYRRLKLVKDFFSVSCTSLKNIIKLKSLITHHAHEALNKLTPSNMTLQERIADLDAKLKFEEAIYQLRRKGRNTISMTELLSLAKTTMPDASPDALQSALTFAAGLGAYTYFPQSLCEKIPRLRKDIPASTPRLIQELVVINPNWLVKLLLPVKLGFLKKKSDSVPGIIKLSRLLKSWAQEEIDPSLYDDLFELLIHYKIIYSLPSLVAQAEEAASPAGSGRQSRDSADGKDTIQRKNSVLPEAPPSITPQNHLLAIPMLFPLWSSATNRERSESSATVERTPSDKSLATRGRSESFFDSPISPRSGSKSSLALQPQIPNTLVRYFVFPSGIPWFLMELVTVQLYIGTVLSSAAQAAIGPMTFQMFTGGNVLNVSGQFNSRSEMRVLGGPTNDAAIVWTITGPSVIGHTRFLTDSFNHLMQGEFSGVKYDIQCPCTCTTCTAKTSALRASNSGLHDAVFNLAELEERYATGASVAICPATDMPVAIEKMAPEVALADMRAIQVEYDAVKMEKLVAQGGFGKVFRAALGGATVAVKEIICDDETNVGGSFREFRRECWIMAIVSQSPYIVSLKGFSIKKCRRMTGRDPASFCLIMDFIPCGNLHSYLHKPEAALSWHLRRKIARDVAAGLVFLHGAQVLHHDLKSLNIFLNSVDVNDEVVAKVGDFGEARISFSYSKRDNVSNPTWLAPEVLLNEPYSKKSDVYSFGIVLFELASRELPFSEYPEGNTPFVFELEAAIKRGLRPNMKRLLSEETNFDWSSTENKCPAAWESLYTRCVAENPLRRPDFAEILAELEQMGSS